MKRLILFFLFLVINNIYIFGQVSESFEGSFPPNGWVVSHSAGTTDWVQASTLPNTGTYHANSTSPATGAAKTLALSLNVASNASSVSYWIAVSSIGGTTVSTLQIYAGTNLSSLTLLRTISIEGLAAAGTYYQYTDYIDGTSNQSSNSIDLRGLDNVYIAWLHNKTSGSTAPACRLDDVSILNATALPVELTSFISNVEGNKIELNWRTATEVNNYGFEIERSQTSNVKSETWEKIGFVQGNGNSNSPKNYSFTDEPTGGKEFKYRLKQIDIDGAFEYSFEITAKLENVSNYKLDQNFPNPFNPYTKISYTIPQKAYVHLRVYDMLAKQVAELVNTTQESGRYEATFDGSKLPSGVYFYKLEAENYIEVKKLLLVK